MTVGSALGVLAAEAEQFSAGSSLSSWFILLDLFTVPMVGQGYLAQEFLPDLQDELDALVVYSHSFSSKIKFNS